MRATRSSGSEQETLGVVAKFFQDGSVRVPSRDMHRLTTTALALKLDRAILVSNIDFSEQTRHEIGRDYPLEIELIGISELKSWAARLRDSEEEGKTEVFVLFRDMSRRLAYSIARDMSVLAHLEWRDVERVIAEVFEGLGFEVRLTPGSKDGGKDVILTCTLKGKEVEYYVEIKHWRSATRVGSDAVEKLLKVVVKENKQGGLLLSTYGYTSNAFEQLTTIQKKKLRFGDQYKMAALCRTYVKAQAGLWSPPEELSEVLWDV